MAGRKQHYIPQVLQRAFEAGRTGTKSQVLVFRKGRSAYLTSTEGAGAERDFYSNPLTDGKGALDDKITDFEADHLVPILRVLWSIDSGDVDAELASVIVAHLAFRTAHVRGTMSTVMDGAMVQMKSILDDPEAVRRFVEVDSTSSNSIMIEKVRDELSKLDLGTPSENERKAVERIIIFRLRERFDDLIAGAKDVMFDGLSALKVGMPSTIANAHARALSDSLVPPERIRTLKDLNWRIVAADTQERHFILPDCVAVASSTADGEFKPFWMLSSDEAEIVVMPLSPRQILIGAQGATRFVQDEINRQFAICSQDFFISSKKDNLTTAVAESIGAGIAGLNLSLLEDEVGSANQVSGEDASVKGRLMVRTPSGRFGDAAKKILFSIAENTAEAATINRIESIIVPTNLKATLAEIHKRHPSDPELQAAASGAVELMQSGLDWKCHVIVPRGIAETLVHASSSVQRLFATRLVKISLGRAYYIDCWARQCPGIFGPQESDVWSQLVFGMVLRSASYYFGGLASASHGPEPLPGGDNLKELASSLRSGALGLKTARQRFYTHRVFDQLLLEAMLHIEIILDSVARVCGFLEAKNTTIMRDSDAGKLLSELGLWEWSLLYAKDLRRHYGRRDFWSSRDELDQLASHVERLLWTIGTFVLKTNDGLWVEVWPDERMAGMVSLLRA